MKKKDKIYEVIWRDCYQVSGWEEKEDIRKSAVNTEANYIISSVGYFIGKTKYYFMLAQAIDGWDNRCSDVVHIPLTAIIKKRIIKKGEI